MIDFKQAEDEYFKHHDPYDDDELIEHEDDLYCEDCSAETRGFCICEGCEDE